MTDAPALHDTGDPGGAGRQKGPVAGPDGRLRCPWGLSAPEYVAYHDDEWGRPVRGDQPVFERLCLEAFQSGLSWLTILRKRENFRKAFTGFDIQAVAAFTDTDVARLLADAGIVRNRAKVNAAITNARAALELREGLSDLVWGYAETGPRPVPRTLADIPAQTAASRALAKELRKRGFVFTGPVTSTPPCRPAAWSTTTWKRVSPVPGRPPRKWSCAWIVLSCALSGARRVAVV
jgi:DNA-3-methyladenine glycosylase I